MHFPLPQPALVWGLMPRFLGLIYIFAFVSVDAFARSTSRGMNPISDVFAKIAADFPGPRRFLDYPTLLWIVRSDAGIRVLPWLGVACGALAIYGGTLGFVGLFGAWLLWLSLEPLEYWLAWDTLLSEIGFLLLFLPISEPLPLLTATALPLPSVAFMVRWLLLRLILGFGMNKFGGVKRDDGLYLKSFFVWIPLPNRLGWLTHHAPHWLLRLAHTLMLLVEVVVPLFGYWAGWPRLVAYFGFVGLMMVIGATANWGIFNLAFALFSTCLLDIRSSIFDLSVASLTQWPDALVHAVMAVLFVISLFYFPVNSWFTRVWLTWPLNYVAWRRVSGPLRAFRGLLAITPVRLLRWLAPLRVVSGYGVFPPNSVPPLRVVPLVEGSDDGVTWKPYAWRFLPSDERDAPPLLPPITPRGDIFAFYFAHGVHSAGLSTTSSVLGSPYFSYGRVSHCDLLLQNLLEHAPAAHANFRRNPFPHRPPKQVRIAAVALTPTTAREARDTGRFWNVHRMGLLVGARGMQSWPRKLKVQEPETFHPDYVDARRRTPKLAGMVEALRAGQDPNEALLVASDLTAREVDAFWQRLVPMLVEQRGNWSAVHERARAIEACFDVEALYRMERILERFVWLLRCRIEERSPRLHERLNVSNFRFHMMLHEAVSDGIQAYRRYLEEPDLLLQRLARSNDASQLWVITLLRYEQMMMEMAVFRIHDVNEKMHALGLPGVHEYIPFLAQHVPPLLRVWPKTTKLANGDFTIEWVANSSEAPMAASPSSSLAVSGELAT